MCSLKGLNTGLRADAAQGKGCVQEEIFMSRSAKNDKTKTNVMRLLDAAKIPYEAKEYPVDENDLSGSHAADMLGVDHGSVFKTLVLKGERTGFLVCCIPVDGEVDAADEGSFSHNGVHPRWLFSYRNEEKVPDFY